jgi:hypothetical protein
LGAGGGDVLDARAVDRLVQLRLGQRHLGLRCVEGSPGVIHQLPGGGVPGGKPRLAVVAYLGVHQDRLGVGEVGAGLGDVLGPGAVHQLVQLRLRAVAPRRGHGHGAAVGRVVEPGDRLAGLDRFPLLPGHGGHGAFAVEGEVHLADLDVAVQDARGRAREQTLKAEPAAGQNRKRRNGDGETLHAGSLYSTGAIRSWVFRCLGGWMPAAGAIRPISRVNRTRRSTVEAS